jgi:hypothetical protein
MTTAHYMVLLRSLVTRVHVRFEGKKDCVYLSPEQKSGEHSAIVLKYGTNVNSTHKWNKFRGTMV